MSAGITTIYSLVSILLLWVAVFWLYRDVAIDTFRQKVFALRDELFDEARSGNISFDDTAYGMLRTTMNGAIRFAHALSFVQFIIGAGKKEASNPRSFSTTFVENVNSLSAEKQEVYSRYVMRFHRLLLSYLLLGSPLVIITVVVPLALFVLVKRCMGWLLANFKGRLEAVDDIAYAAGSPDGAAA